MVVHLHGSFQAQGAPPLVTWQDYLQAYGWFSPSAIKELASYMVDTSGLTGPARRRYAQLLSMQLEMARISADSKRYSGRVPQVIDDLLANKTCLFIGFSFLDPIWRLLLHRLKASRAVGRYHFIIAKDRPPKHLTKVVRSIPIEEFSEIGRVLHWLSAELGRGSPSGRLGEERAREDHYEHLRRRYPRLDARTAEGFIAQGQNPQGISTLVPFTEVWCNSEKLPTEKAVEVLNVAPKRFAISRELLEVKKAYWALRRAAQKKKRDSAPLVNEPKLRIQSVQTAPDGHLFLNVQLADYKDFLVTNHLVANMDSRERSRLSISDKRLGDLLQIFVTKGRFDPRQILCANDESIVLSPSALCSNHLGVSLLAIADISVDGVTVPALLCPPTRGQISSPRDIVMTSSGSVDWPLSLDAKRDNQILTPDKARPASFRLADQIWREFSEECLFNPKQEALLAKMPSGPRMERRFQIARRDRRKWILNSALINLCQNIERGGKPELFYVASIKGSGIDFIQRELNFSWELMPIHTTEIAQDTNIDRGRRRMMCLRSPLDRNLQVVADPEPAFEQLLSVILDSHFNPVLRAHLASLIRWCFVLEPSVTERILTAMRSLRDFFIVGMKVEAAL